MSSDHINLTIAFSTLAARAGGISVPDLGPDAEVLVCVQGEADIDRSRLAGARIVKVSGRGVAKSRNASMDHARGRYLLFCDDDVVVNADGVAEGVRHLKRTGHALVLGRGVDPSGSARKRYPSSVTRLTKLNSAKAATYEMLVDLEQVRTAGLHFDVRFGAGADLYLGDEYVFIADLLDAGLSGDSIPAVFGTHPAESSGSRWGTARDRHARAVVINRVFGRRAIWARVAFALKNWVNLGGWRAVAAFVANGSRATSEPHARGDGGTGSSQAAARHLR